jgi:hypothetical protein
MRAGSSAAVRGNRPVGVDHVNEGGELFEEVFNWKAKFVVVDDGQQVRT